METKRTYTIKVNRSKRTYTIRVFENGKLINKYRSTVQSKLDFMEFWTESEYIEEVSEIYQFSGGNGYKVQILTY